MRKSEFISSLKEMESRAFRKAVEHLQKTGITEAEACKLANSILGDLRSENQRVLEQLEPLWMNLMTPQEKLEEVVDRLELGAIQAFKSVLLGSDFNPDHVAKIEVECKGGEKIEACQEFAEKLNLACQDALNRARELQLV